jgi:hypothetical protein
MRWGAIYARRLKKNPPPPSNSTTRTMTSNVVVSISTPVLWFAGYPPSTSMRRTLTSVCAVENTPTWANSAATSPLRTLSEKRFDFRATMSTALQCLLQLGGETEHERGRHVEIREALVDVRRRRARRRRSVLGTGRSRAVRARPPAHVRPDAARQLASTVGRSVGSLRCCWSLRWCSRRSVSPVWV